MTSPERTEVWQERDDSWRWRYVADGGVAEPVVIPGNEPESSCEDAVAAAEVAYPGLPLEVREPATVPGAGRRRRRSGVLRPVVLASLAGAAAVRHPRWWTALPALAAVVVLVRRLRRR